MNISQNFPCGNIQVIKIEGDDITVEPEVRGDAPYFYWCFSVGGAEGRTLRFHFPSDTRVGFPGAAVSHDMESWAWSNSRTEDESGEGFTYTFAPDEHLVYFAHDMVYTPHSLDLVLDELGLQKETFCTGYRGSDVPCFTVGNGTKTVLITSRQHACESPGTYVLEGIVREFSENPIPAVKLLVVPFVDYEGVIRGDAGKDRKPHDHNRDYDLAGPALYPETGKIRALAEAGEIFAAIDLHAPHHSGSMNDYPYIFDYEDSPRQAAFSARIVAESDKAAAPIFKFGGRHNFSYYHEWNSHTLPNIRNFMTKYATLHFGISMETPYFGLPGNFFTQAGAVTLGRCLWRAFAPEVTE